MLRILFLFIFIFFESKSFSKDEYFLTLRYDEVNLRQGPSRDYPVKIFYKKKFLPVIIQDKSGNFRKVRDHENNTGWIHLSQLSKKKAAIVTKNQIMMFKGPTIYSKPIAMLKEGRLVKILNCKEIWCKVKTNKIKGWIKKENLWGLL